MLIYIKAENKYLKLLPCPTSAVMDCVFHVYMQQEDKEMVMTLYMTIVKQHLQHIMTPKNNNIYDSSETINTPNKA
jgi:predicted small metal-binding protein